MPCKMTGPKILLIMYILCAGIGIDGMVDDVKRTVAGVVLQVTNITDQVRVTHT